MLEKIVPLKVFLNTLRINTSQPLGKAWFHLHSHHWWGLACSGGEKRAMDIAGVTWPKPTETYKFTLVRCWKPVLFLFWSALPWVTVGSLKVITRPKKKKKKKKLQGEERRKGQRSPLWTCCEQQASCGQSLVGTTQTWRISSSVHKSSSNFWRVQKIYDKV